MEIFTHALSDRSKKSMAAGPKLLRFQVAFFFFFFFEKNFADPGRMFPMILEKIGVIYFQSRRRVGVK